MPTRDDALTVAPSWGRRLLGMEGLRGIAAVTVVIGHVRGHLAGDVDLDSVGFFLYLVLNGLTLFFALSGFLLFRPFATALITGQRFPNVARFFQNRALRIFPGYLAIFILVAFVIGSAYTMPAGPTTGSEGVGEQVGFLTDPSVILPNLFMLQTFFPFSIKTGLGVAWSLTVELVFYAVLPLLGILAWKAMKRLRPGSIWPALIPAMAMIAVGTIGKVVFALTFHPADANESFFLQWGGSWYAVFSRSFLVHADLFAYGMIAAIVVAMIEAGRIPERLLPAVRWTSFFVAPIAAVLSVFFSMGPWQDTAYAVSFGALILFVALPNRSLRPGLLARVLEFAPIRYVGVVSYSLYLWHLPVIWTLDRIGVVGPATPAGFWLNVVLVLGVSLVLSTGTYFLIEKPPLKLKKRTDRGAIETPTETVTSSGPGGAAR